MSLERSAQPDAQLQASRVTSPPTKPGLEAMELFRCHSCGEVIGVYEPLVVCEGDSARITSRAAEPDLKADDGVHYHRDCHVSTAHGDPRDDGA